MSDSYPAAFIYATEIVMKMCPTVPLNKLPGCWEYTFGKTSFKINGHSDERDGVPPYSVAFEVNGWPVGVVDPGGGCVLGVSEDELVEALKAECERIRDFPEASLAGAKQ